MNVTDTPSLPTDLQTSANTGKPTRIAQAAQQFESLMIGEMLKSAREDSDEGWMGSGSDSSAESAMGIAESQFSQAIAAGGGFGLAKMIERSMSRVTQSPVLGNGAVRTK
jgi:Rod binding domain-containing protein